MNIFMKLFIGEKLNKKKDEESWNKFKESMDTVSMAKLHIKPISEMTAEELYEKSMKVQREQFSGVKEEVYARIQSAIETNGEMEAHFEFKAYIEKKLILEFLEELKAKGIKSQVRGATRMYAEFYWGNKNTEEEQTEI